MVAVVVAMEERMAGVEEETMENLLALVAVMVPAVMEGGGAGKARADLVALVVQGMRTPYREGLPSPSYQTRYCALKPDPPHLLGTW